MDADAFVNGAVILSSRVAGEVRAAAPTGNPELIRAVIETCGERAMEALSNRLLTQFDLDKCSVPVLPEDFYEK